jgi:hypothetical protein
LVRDALDHLRFKKRGVLAEDGLNLPRHILTFQDRPILSPEQKAFKPAPENIVYFFPLQGYQMAMNVAENDNAVRGMLEEELHRCRDVLAALEVKAAEYPNGSLHIRKKRYKEREYAYHSLVFRNGDRVVNRHIPEKNMPELKKQLEKRDKCLLEIQNYRNRIDYLEKLLRLPGQHEASKS